MRRYQFKPVVDHLMVFVVMVFVDRCVPFPRSLDPDFDYDNVVLTRREWPYTMLNARWPGQAGAGR